MADDLGDDWWEAGAPVVAEERNVETIQNTRTNQKKRPFVASVNGWQPSLSNPNSQEPSTVGGVGQKKKRKKRKTKTEELAENVNPIEPLKEFYEVMKKKEEDLTIVEREEINMDALNIIHQKLDGGIESTLRTSLGQCAHVLTKQAKSAGQPFVLFLTASAIRAVDLKRNLSNVSSECKIAKLFAKHMKIKDQVSFLAKTSINAAIGTPKRVHELIELKALKLSKLKYILLDWTWRDTKLRRMVDISEVKQELLNLLIKYLFNSSEKYNTQIVLL